MVSLDEIQKTILELEQKDTSFAVCEKLSWLYVCRDHMQPSQNARQAVQDSDSEFIRIAKNAPYNILLNVMDSLMEQIKVMFPKEYERIIFRLNGD